MDRQELAELIGNIQSGDAAAFGHLVTAFQDMAVGYAFAIVGDFQLAEDVAQEAFLTAFEQPKLRDVEAFPGWFRSIVSQRSLQAVRRLRNRRESAETSANTISELSEPAKDLAQDDLADRLTQLVLFLPVPERIAAALFYYGEYSQPEIADFLSVPLSTVKNRLRSARSRLKENLEEMVQDTLERHRPSLDRRFVDRVQIAIESGRYAEVARLVREEPGVLQRRGDDLVGRTPLHLAAQRGQEEIVRLLLKEGADVDARNTADSATPLHFAAENGHLSIVRLLVDAGSPLEAADNVHEGAPLRWATSISRFHLEVAEFLLASGASHDLFTATAMNDGAAVRKLLGDSPELLNATLSEFEYHEPAMHLAARRGCCDAIRELATAGADLDLLNWWGLTALAVAQVHGRREVIDLLLALGTEPDLGLAVTTADCEAARSFAEQLPEGLTKSPYRKLIHYFSQRGDRDAVECLVALGADVDARLSMPGLGAKEVVPLHAAAAFDHREVIRCLVHGGADLRAMDGTWKATPLQWAEYNGRSKAVSLLASFTR